MYDLEQARTVEFMRRWIPLGAEEWVPRLDRAHAAARLAHAYVLDVHGFVTPAQNVTVAGCWHLTVLHGAIDQFGCPFEAIASVTNLEVATRLASITPDNRLPPPRRYLMHVSDLGQADEFGQIVRLVQLAGELRYAKQYFEEQPESRRAWLKELLSVLDRYVSALAHLTEFTSLQPFWQRVQQTSSILAEAAERRRAATAVLRRVQFKTEHHVFPTLAPPTKAKPRARPRRR